MSQILEIDSIADIKKVGSLGSYLAILRRSGITVVDGFVLPIDFSLENGGSNELLRAFDKLKSEYVIVRSSEFSHESEGEVLRKVPRDALVDAVSYIIKKIKRRGGDTAIIVQKDLTAELSGTVYAYNPTTNNKHEVMIEAHLWMNDTVLVGENEPDIILIDKATGTLTMEDNEEDELYLTPRQIREVYSLLRRVELCSSLELSIDWAFDNGKLYVLNVRPMTRRIRERLF